MLMRDAAYACLHGATSCRLLGNMAHGRCRFAAAVTVVILRSIATLQSVRHACLRRCCHDFDYAADTMPRRLYATIVRRRAMRAARVCAGTRYARSEAILRRKGAVPPGARQHGAGGASR